MSYPVPMTDTEARELRRKLDSIPRGRGRRIPLELRARATAWVAKRRECGDGWGELVDKLGVPASTLQRWTSGPSSRAVMLRRVEIAALAPAPAPAERTVTLVSPTGVRVEGVTISDVIEILRGLT
jgi:hypothetical protein